MKPRRNRRKGKAKKLTKRVHKPLDLSQNKHYDSDTESNVSITFICTTQVASILNGIATILSKACLNKNKKSILKSGQHFNYFIENKCSIQTQKTK